VAPTAKQFSLPKWAACSEPVLAAELGSLQFSLPNWLPAAKQFSMPNWVACIELVLAADFYNKPPRQK